MQHMAAVRRRVRQRGARAAAAGQRAVGARAVQARLPGGHRGALGEPVPFVQARGR